MGSWVLKTQSVKSWSNFHFLGGGRGWERKKGILGYSKLKVTSNQIYISGGGGSRGGRGSFAKNRVLFAKWTKNSGSPACSCITDSLSYTMFVETKISLAKVTLVTNYQQLPGVFPKWRGNSPNSANLINHWSMNWGQFKDPFCYACLAGFVAASCSLT